MGTGVGLLLILSQGLPEPNIKNKRTTLRFLFNTNLPSGVGVAKTLKIMFTGKEKCVVFKMIGTINKAFGGSSNLATMRFFDKFDKEVIWSDAEMMPFINMTASEINETLKNMSDEHKFKLCQYLQELAKTRTPIDPYISAFIDHVDRVQQGIAKIELNQLYRAIWG